MKYLFSVLIALLLCVCQSAVAAGNWAYHGKNGPSTWWHQSDDFAACKTSTQQSPIDITHAVSKDDEYFVTHYSPTKFNVRRDEHNVYFDIAHQDGHQYVNYQNHRYYVKSFHFHTPSEHKILHKQYPMEVHIVNVSRKGKVLVLGTVLKGGAKNALLAQVFSQKVPAVGGKGEKSLELNLTDLIPENSKYFSYAGSLTTPPCTPANWLVMQKPLTVAKSQVKMFKNKVISVNNRPIQAVNDRKIFNVSRS